MAQEVSDPIHPTSPVEGELAGLDAHIVQVEEILVGLLYRQTEHYARS